MFSNIKKENTTKFIIKKKEKEQMEKRMSEKGSNSERWGST